jgi:hypothetical protein
MTSYKISQFITLNYSYILRCTSYKVNKALLNKKPSVCDSSLLVEEAMQTDYTKRKMT